VLRGLLIIHESGAPIYSFSMQKMSDDQQLLLSGFLSAIESFASETSVSPDGGSIHSIELSQLLLTFRILNLQNDKGGLIQYYFVLISDVAKKTLPDNESLLEYVILNFLSYKNGDFRRKMKQTGYKREEFSEFDEFMKKIMNQDWNSIRKKVKPVPGSLVQGVLNEIRDYIPLDQILQLHPKIVRLGASYALLSDDLPETEVGDLLDRIRQKLSRLFGEDLYSSIIDEVEKQLNAQVGTSV